MSHERDKGAAAAATDAGTPSPSGAAGAAHRAAAPASSRRWRWRWWKRVALLLLTFSLCLGAGALVRRESQRRAALRIIEECDARCYSWRGLFGREPGGYDPFPDEARRRIFLYPEVIGLKHDPGASSSFIAALEVLRPKTVVMTWVDVPRPEFWTRLGQITSLRALHIHAGGQAFDDSSLRALAGLPHLTALNLRGTRITAAGLSALAACPELQTLNLGGTPITHLEAESFQELRPSVRITLNGVVITEP